MNTTTPKLDGMTVPELAMLEREILLRMKHDNALLASIRKEKRKRH